MIKLSPSKTFIRSRCSACDAWVRWGETEAGKAMILDAEPNPKGNCELEGVVYLAHWATCPKAKEFKRK